MCVCVVLTCQKEEQRESISPVLLQSMYVNSQPLSIHISDVSTYYYEIDYILRTDDIYLLLLRIPHCWLVMLW